MPDAPLARPPSSVRPPSTSSGPQSSSVRPGPLSGRNPTMSGPISGAPDTPNLGGPRTASSTGGTPASSSFTMGSQFARPPNTGSPGPGRIASGFGNPLGGAGGPATQQECEVWAKRLSDPGLDLQRRLQLAFELRDSADTPRDVGIYAAFLDTLVPAVATLLLEGSPAPTFQRDTMEQRFRSTLLAFLQRLPHNETLRQHESRLMTTALALLKVENEDNALLCIKIIIDGFRSHKNETNEHVQPFLDLVKQMYSNMRTVVEKEFGSPNGSAEQPGGSISLKEVPVATQPALQPQNQPPTPSSATPSITSSARSNPAPSPIDAGASAPSGPTAGPTGNANVRPPVTNSRGSTSTQVILPHALHSPKVLTECPIAVVLIFQSYRTVMMPAMKDFYPLVMESIAIQPEPQRQAYLAAQAKGETFCGVSPAIKNREMYTEVIKAQVKTMAFLAYVSRGSTEYVRNYVDVFPEACVRLLRDCPPEDVATRKELLIATRHMLSSDFRTAFVPLIDTLLDERVLVGSGVTSREALRPLAYSTLADLIHHVRNELSQQQLAKVVAVYSCINHDPTYPLTIQNMCSKMIQTSIDAICDNGDKEEASRLMRQMLITMVEKLKSLYRAFDKVRSATALDKGKGRAPDEEDAEKDPVGASALEWRNIERAMPVTSAAFASESLESFLRDAKNLLRTLLNTFRALFTNMREQQSPSPDGEILEDLFKYGILSLQMFEGSRDPREEKEGLEQIGAIFQAFEPHVFCEIWTNGLEFFLAQALEHHHIIQVLQTMLVHNEVSHQSVAILLKYLLSKLEQVGEQSKLEASLTLKLFKLAFMAVNTFIETNEALLVPHLANLIMDCFTYAAKAPDPWPYYQILRALFRSIGGGRFEALYKEVLPILEEMLETLNYLLQHCEPAHRDLFVELSLTVPVRLTNLLPHLGYLMKPLVHALNAGPDLVSQGLRTLELCIDNLTSDFLDPTMRPVIRELMSALYNLLQPLPYNHQHAHSAVKILGKLGGRNRRFQQSPYLLESSPSSAETFVTLSLEGRDQDLAVSSWIDLAVDHVRNQHLCNRQSAVRLLKEGSMIYLGGGFRRGEQEASLEKILAGLFEASTMDEFKQEATDHLKRFMHEVVVLELSAQNRRSSLSSLRNSVICTCVLDSFTLCIASATPAHRDTAESLVEAVTDDIMAQQARAEEQNEAGYAATTGKAIIQSLFTKFASLCFEEDWNRKLGGCLGIRVLITRPKHKAKWTADRQLDVARALFYVLRDSPKDTPRALTTVVDMLKSLVRTCYEDNPNDIRLPKLIDMLVLELPSPKMVVRDAAKACIGILAEIKESTEFELIGASASERLLDSEAGPIFNKPLRALPFGMQIGNIDAITYLVNLKPTLPQLATGAHGEDFSRLLHEVIALADADDASLIGRASHHSLEVSLRDLRIACLKLLCAAMSCTDVFNKQQHSLRSRVIAVYFKHMYSSAPKIVDVAHEGLRSVLTVQAKLPKDVLQTGLRPILINLAETRRLSVSGLEGLSRFLELLTNYFKVEIGAKLLDHFRTLAAPAMLAQAAQGLYDDNADIARMVRLITVFRLLPSTANIFLKDLTTSVSDAESRLLQAKPGPFTENLALYLNKYAIDATAFLLESITNNAIVRTYRHVVSSGKAPALVAEISKQSARVCELCFSQVEGNPSVLSGIHILDAVSRQSPQWLAQHREVLEALVSVWRVFVARARNSSIPIYDNVYDAEPILMVGIFLRYLQTTQDVELLFHVAEIFEIRSALDRGHVADFFYGHIASDKNLDYQKEVLRHFLALYENEAVPSTFKMHAFRFVINPMLLVHFERTPITDLEMPLVNAATAQLMAKVIWHPLLQQHKTNTIDDSLVIEVLHATAILVQHASSVIGEVRKDIIKVAWECIRSPDATVKHMAYLLAARFFAAFDSPETIVRTTWHGLLKVKETESRALYRQAIDILAASLPIRDPPPANGGPAHWALATKRVLTEEGHTTPQLVSICELIVAHPDLFYESREMFVSLMANSLTKLGFVPAATADMKKLTIDIVELVFRWERRRITVTPGATNPTDEQGAPKRPSPGDLPAAKRQKTDRAGSINPVQSSSGWQLPVHVRELITSYLVRLVSTSLESISRGGLTARALNLLREVLGPQGLPGVTAKLSFFQKAMSQEVTEQNFVVVCNSAEVIGIVAKNKDSAWIMGHLVALQKLLEQAVLSDFAQLHEILRPTLERMFLCLPKSADEGSPSEEVLAFYNWAEAIAEGLNKSDKDKSGLTAKDRLQGPLYVVQCYVKARPDKLEAFAPSLTRLLSRLVRDFTGQSGGQLSQVAAENAHRSILAILEICRERLPALKELRRIYLGAIYHLIEFCPSVSLCRYLLDMLKDWVLLKRETGPSLKEQAGLITKMMTYEVRTDDSLFTDYLEFVLDIFSDPSLHQSDLTSRLENAFFLGTRCKEPALRMRFIDMLDKNLPTDIFGRMRYLLSTQDWGFLANSYWIVLAADLLLGCVQQLQTEVDIIEMAAASIAAAPNSTLLDKCLDRQGLLLALRRLLHLDPEIAHKVWVDLFSACWHGFTRTQQIEVQRWLTVLLSKGYHIEQLSLRPNVPQSLLTGANACGSSLLLPPYVVKYLGKTYNAWHVSLEILTRSLEGYDADETLRDTCANALSELYTELSEDDLFYGLWRRRCLHEETNSALALEQNGLWPRAQEAYETAQNKARNGVIPYTEQEYSLWQDHWILAAQKLQQWDILTDLARHENNHDLLLECAWRLSDWGSADREMIERTLEAVSDVATPRRKVFEAYTALIKAHTGQERPSDFLRVLDEAIQLSIRKWVNLPEQLSAAHTPLLQLFQQYVELQEAAGVFESLTLTNQVNLEHRATSDLKPIFTTWRERLPNFWEDISVWSDLLAWRQHVFSAVTKVYVPLIPPGDPATFGYRGYHETAWTINRFGHVARKHQLSEVCASALSKIYALPNIEICEAFLKLREQAMCYYQKPDKLVEGLDSISTTNLLYFAPDQKAEFLTLKGMFIAKLGQADDANLAFAQAVQMDLNLPKAWAEWGKYNDRLFRDRPIPPPPVPEDAQGNPQFSQDQWASQYNMERIALAANAVSCYLQAAGLYKSAKARKLVLRVLWLLALDDSTTAISRAFEAYQGDAAVWYWIHLIPALIASLNHREARHAKGLLTKIAKTFPQALFYNLRTTRNEFALVNRQQQQYAYMQHLNKRKMAAARQASIIGASRLSQAPAEPVTSEQTAELPSVPSVAVAAPAAQRQTETPDVNVNPPKPEPAKDDGAGDVTMEDVEQSTEGRAAKAQADPASSANPSSEAPIEAAPETSGEPSAQPLPSQSVLPPMPQIIRGTGDHVDDVLNMLKTAFPLLALSMEKMVDHIGVRTKVYSEEELYRILAVLLELAVSVSTTLRLFHELRRLIVSATQLLKQKYTDKIAIPRDDAPVPPDIRDRVISFLQKVPRADVRAHMAQTLLGEDVSLREHIKRLQHWHSRFDRAVHDRPRKEPLDVGECLLSDFHHSKFDDVEVPGQYLEHVDNNNDFDKIARFSPTIDMNNGYSWTYRRFTLISTNGSRHSFSAQTPVGRYTRREERVYQLFRILNNVLQKRKESRKRNLTIFVPAIVPISAAVRLVANDSSYISLQDILDQHGKANGWLRDQPMIDFIDKWRQLYIPTAEPLVDAETVEYKVTRMELVEEIAAKYVPDNLITNYMIKTMSTPSSLWLMRKQFALQTASTMFMSYTACLNCRKPSTFHFSLKTGQMYMSELLPSFADDVPIHQLKEKVPFRLTPNMQHFITPTGIEGLLTSGVTAMARSLTMPEYDMESCLSLLIKEECQLWYNMKNKHPTDYPQNVYAGVDAWVNRTEQLAYTGENDDKSDLTPVVAVITNLIDQATNTQCLASTPEPFMPWF